MKVKSLRTQFTDCLIEVKYKLAVCTSNSLPHKFSKILFYICQIRVRIADLSVLRIHTYDTNLAPSSCAKLLR